MCREPLIYVIMYGFLRIFLRVYKLKRVFFYKKNGSIKVILNNFSMSFITVYHCIKNNNKVRYS
jgi:hypothetical protein